MTHKRFYHGKLDLAIDKEITPVAIHETLSRQRIAAIISGCGLNELALEIFRQIRRHYEIGACNQFADLPLPIADYSRRGHSELKRFMASYKFGKNGIKVRIY